RSDRDWSSDVCSSDLVNKLIITSNLAGKYGDALINDIPNRGLYSEKNYPGAAFGSSVTGGLEGETNLYFTDNLTLIKGKHQLKEIGRASCRERGEIWG